MFSKAEKNYFLNIMLLIIGATCAITGILIDIKPLVLAPILLAIKAKSLHEWSGYLSIILVIVHLIYHFDWIKLMTKSMRTARTKASVALAVALISIFFCVSISFLAPTSKKLPGGASGKQSKQQEQVIIDKK